MPYLVDGDNLLGTWPGRQRSDDARRDLVFELDRFAARRGRRVVVVFDGAARDGSGSSAADVHYAGHDRTADDVILDLLRRFDDPRGWTVVSSDRSLRDRCRHLEARVERCDVFRRRLGDDPAPEKPDSEGDLDFWLERFGRGG